MSQAESNPLSAHHTVQELLERLQATSQAERLAAIEELSRRRSLRAVKPLVHAHMRRTLEEQDAILNCLRAMGEAALPPLNTIFLKDVNPGLRAHAAYLLGELGYAQSVRVLTRGITMPHELVRAMAVAALSKFNDDDTVLSAFLAALHDHANSVKIEAALALGRRGDVRATPMLLRVVDEQLVLPQNLPLVIEALAKTGDPRAVEAIYDLYLRENYVVRVAAVLALRDLAAHDPRAVTVLREAIHDPDAVVRARALDMLRELGRND